MIKISETELNNFRNYINSFSWRNAKTYEAFSPHEYILNFPCWKLKEDKKCNNNCEQCKKDRKEFEHWVMFIRENGERVLYGKNLYTCLRCDDKHYWTGGEDLETTWVLNRAITNDPRYRVLIEWLDN